MVCDRTKGTRPVDRAVTEEVIASWVTIYREALLKPGRFTSIIRRGSSQLVGITESLVPETLRSRLHQGVAGNDSCVTILPAGKLYQLPFEALVVTPGPPSRFLTDDLAGLPFAYAPSIMILDALMHREKPRRAARYIGALGSQSRFWEHDGPKRPNDRAFSETNGGG